MQAGRGVTGRGHLDPSCTLLSRARSALGCRGRVAPSASLQGACLGGARGSLTPGKSLCASVGPKPAQPGVVTCAQVLSGLWGRDKE